MMTFKQQAGLVSLQKALPPHEDIVFMAFNIAFYECYIQEFIIIGIQSRHLNRNGLPIIRALAFIQACAAGAGFGSEKILRTGIA